MSLACSSSSLSDTAESGLDGGLSSFMLTEGTVLMESLLGVAGAAAPGVVFATIGDMAGEFFTLAI